MPAWQAVPDLRIPAEDADHALPSREVADVADERLRPNGVVHDGARLEHRAPARLLDPPRQIGVLAEGTAEALIEPADPRECVLPIRIVARLVEAPPPVGRDAAAEWSAAPRLRRVGQRAPLYEVGILQLPHETGEPVLRRTAVIVGEGDERRTGGSPPDVPCRGRPPIALLPHGDERDRARLLEALELAGCRVGRRV